MNDLDRERERIGRQLEEGYLSPGEHRRIARAIDREEARRAKSAAEDARRIARYRLRSQLLHSLERA